MIYFSRSTLGFYDDSVHGTRLITVESDTVPGEFVEVANPLCRIPVDAVEISDETRDAMIAGEQAGRVISAGPDGYPVLIDRPAPTVDQLIAAAVAEKARLSAICTYQIGVLTNAVDPDVVDDPDPTDAALLILWKKYQQALRKVVTTAVPVTWPPLPALASGTSSVSVPVA